MELRVVLCVMFAVCLLVRVAGDECPTLSPEKLTKLKSMIVTEDVHDELVGELRDYWGSKVLFEEDNSTCLKYSRVKVDDKALSQTVDIDGKWFGGKQSRRSTLEKIENGVYFEILQLPSNPRFVLAKVYVLYAKHNVFAYFWCAMYSAPEGSKGAKLPSVSGVAVKTDLAKMPLEPAIQEAVDEAVKKIQGAPELLGEITQFTPC